jgi:hypothetical protein
MSIAWWHRFPAPTGPPRPAGRRRPTPAGETAMQATDTQDTSPAPPTSAAGRSPAPPWRALGAGASVLGAEGAAYLHPAIGAVLAAAAVIAPWPSPLQK